MRRGDKWAEFAKRNGYDPSRTVATMYFLNLRRDADWIAATLGIPVEFVWKVEEQAKPLLRQTKRGQVLAKFQCHYCGSDTDLTRDHVVPRSRGGSNDPENIVYACRSCNAAKGNRTPEEWLR